MNRKKNFGFTLIELLAVIVVLAVILAIAIPGISGIIKNSTKSAFVSDAKMVLKAIEYAKLKDKSFDPLTITKTNMQQEIGVSDVNYDQVTISVVNNDYRVVLVGTGKWAGLTAYGTFKNMEVINSGDYDVVPPVITITGDNPAIAVIGIAYADAGATANDAKDGDLTSSIVTSGSVNTSTLGTYTITYTVSDEMGNEATSTRTVNVIKDGNAPILATGMIPVKWDGAAWITTTEDDTDWYNYNTIDKKWANAKTADGSMWVWIPRYVYKISSGWNTGIAGTIEVKFSIGTDDTRSGTVTLDTSTASSASNNKWTNHPAFTFDTTELTGLWVAKFEASGTTSAVDILPSVASLRNIQTDAMFTASRNMETNSRYGWGTTGTGIDTHLMKNSEWGLIAYLSQSTYGKNAEIWINPSSTYITGCAGTGASVAASSGCPYYYNTANGQQASTTGNIYGVYDMSGGGWEYVSAYVNNGNSNITVYFTPGMNAAAKYKDVYIPGAPDTQANGYTLAADRKGDAIYETSSSYADSTSWYGDYSLMPYSSYQAFLRGGKCDHTTNAGIFSLYYGTGYADTPFGFRPILMVQTGL